jgi:hypothetical protein
LSEFPNGSGFQNNTATPAWSIDQPVQTFRRSKAWIYYTVLAVCGFLTLCTGHVVGLVGMVLCGLYARYLYRGGRIVVWIW